ncbi:mitochondrial ribosomal protein MRP51 [Neohortaea acidophila]|uniref:Mitochondrial ribosomal protein MRP51 n=1 Tax=Neohortaea acidophila TaxID=245834 RepID=A0A6A6Q071_9PEZI|nr:mitochondrial ribosomal protein MRP51 [Neohortaea acidophila]KAF2484817.1 mitochondrial ribosomal protein MRP51 [Neohortaea acidophila]
MSKSASSPTARLLQSSRLFSLPRRLPIQPELTTGVYRTSDTATTPYPTHQAITTPAASLHRGDWGLKRAIPGRKTKVTTPVIRVRANDTYEHITDFASAGDHVQTERKWAEMGVPFVMEKQSRHSEENAVGVFEAWLDNTDPDAPPLTIRRPVAGRMVVEQSPKQMQRWKHRGPWLAGMQDGDFERYVGEKIGKKKEEWRAFLGKKWRANEIQRAKSDARKTEEPLTEEQVREMENLQPTEEQLSAYEKQLRDDHAYQGLSSNLTALISAFLDLPAVYSAAASRLNPNGLYNQLISAVEGDRGPPTTHPSGGLSHLRTDAIMHNHPIYGPQRDKPPVEARVVRPRTRNGAVLEYMAKLGVGGIVTDDSHSATSRSPETGNMKPEDRATHALDENTHGGNRLWVHPEVATMDHNSRVHLRVNRARAEAVAVRTNNKEELDAIQQSKSSGGGGGLRQAGGVSIPLLGRGGRTSRTPRARVL